MNIVVNKDIGAVVDYELHSRRFQEFSKHPGSFELLPG